MVNGKVEKIKFWNLNTKQLGYEPVIKKSMTDLQVPNNRVDNRSKLSNPPTLTVTSNVWARERESPKRGGGAASKQGYQQKWCPSKRVREVTGGYLHALSPSLSPPSLSLSFMGAVVLLGLGWRLWSHQQHPSLFRLVWIVFLFGCFFCVKAFVAPIRLALMRKSAFVYVVLPCWGCE